MSHIYAILLEHDKYYVGQTNHPELRLEQHHEGCGSCWTMKYKPVQVLFVKLSEGPFDENNTTKTLMIKHGIDNVRGGSYCTEYIDKTQKEILQKELWGVQNVCIRCGYDGHYINVCNKRIDINGNKITLKTKMKIIKNKKDDKKIIKIIKDKKIKECKLCGRNTHITKNCYATTKLSGSPIVKKTCTRCKRLGHKKSKCYAKTDINGIELK